MKIKKFLLVYIVSISFSEDLNFKNNYFLIDYNSEIINYQEHDSWLGSDKIKHFSGSFLLTIFSHSLLNNDYQFKKELSATIVLGVGLSKEIIDSKKKNNFFSIKDLVANITGVGLAFNF